MGAIYSLFTSSGCEYLTCSNSKNLNNSANTPFFSSPRKDTHLNYTNNIYTGNRYNPYFSRNHNNNSLNTDIQNDLILYQEI
jgi:hypothetical protein